MCSISEVTSKLTYTRELRWQPTSPFKPRFDFRLHLALEFSLVSGGLCWILVWMRSVWLFWLGVLVVYREKRKKKKESKKVKKEKRNPQCTTDSQTPISEEKQPNCALSTKALCSVGLQLLTLAEAGIFLLRGLWFPSGKLVGGKYQGLYIVLTIILPTCWNTAWS